MDTDTNRLLVMDTTAAQLYSIPSPGVTKGQLRDHLERGLTGLLAIVDCHGIYTPVSSAATLIRA